jgi:polysaccharide biosynthesis/export protein
VRCREQVSTSGLKRMLSLAAIGVVSLSGCKSWLDQSEVARAEADRLVVPILSRIDPIDEGPMEFEGAREVRPEDLRVVATDYVIGPNDLVTVSIFDLGGFMGVETVRTTRVSETGMLSLPMLLEPIQAAGLTEQQLQRAIMDRYREADILQQARVTVIVNEKRARTFSVMGAVARPGQYAIIETDFRILDALIQAGDAFPTAETLYVIRRPSPEAAELPPAPEPAPPPVRPGQPGEDPLAPPPVQPGPTGAAPAPVQPAPAAPPPAHAPPTAQPAPAAGQPAAAPTADQPAAGEERFIFIDGKAVPMGGATQPVGPRPGVADPAAPGQPPPDAAVAPADAITQTEYEFGTMLMDTTTDRVIRVPLGQLRNGDLRYNIVVRPNDMLVVPQPTPGFYYMSGHVGAPGAYNLTGQKITLKQAIAAARMLDALAVPARTDVIRRVGDNEVFVRVDLGKIYAGREPDLYLKPNDTIVVGTDWYPPFLQAIRGAFRFTYGFGFIYDRNFAPERRGVR